MRTLILQYEEDNSPEHLGEHLDARGVQWNVIRLDQPHESISLSGYDVLIGLGGAMNVDETDIYPFLLEARALVAQAMKEEVPLLGICLTAQMMARALGAPVRRLSDPEIGLIAVTPIAGQPDLLLNGLPSPFATVQFHEDVFHLPDGAETLASSDVTQNQVMRCGPYAYGLQFHPEVALSTFARWMEEGYGASTGNDDSLIRRRIMDEVRACQPAIRAVAARLFDNFLDIASQAVRRQKE